MPPAESPAPTRPDLPRHLVPFIAGEYRARTGAVRLPKLNPATGELLASFAAADESDVDSAFAAARAATRDWQARDPRDRGDILRRLALEIRSEAGGLGWIGTLESGVPARASVAMAHRAADFLDYYAACATDLTDAAVPDLPAGMSGTTDPKPYGVVGVLSSWNGHSGIWRKCAPALAAGNSVVLKPSELAPFAALHYAELTARAGMPPGVFNVVPGGAATGQTVAAHPQVDKLSFTGGRPAAAAVMGAAAQRTTPVLLELGGKSAAVVFDDVDVAEVGRQVALAGMALSGQGCVNPTRVLAQRSIAADLTDAVLDTVSTLRVGDPSSPATDLGPLITAAARHRVTDRIEACQAKGWGRVVVPSGAQPLPERGFYLAPVVIADADMRSPIAQEELFGPVLCVAPFDDDAEAVDVANDTVFGLSAYVFSADPGRARRVAKAMDAGCVSVNRVGPMPPEVPFGGVKGSGFGREGGRQGLWEFVQTRAFYGPSL